MPFDFDAYIANRAAADNKLQAVIDASKEKIADLQAYDASKPQSQGNSWSEQLGLTPGSFVSNRVNDAASLVSGASRLVGQVVSLPVSLDGQSATEGVLPGDIEAYNRVKQNNATPADLERLNRTPVDGQGTMLQKLDYAGSRRETARAINDTTDLTGIVDQTNRQGLTEDLSRGFQPNWDKVKSGEAGQVVSGLAGLLVNAGSALVNNPSAVREYILENAPQLFVGAAGKVGQGVMAASNIGYAVDEFQKGMENYAKANGGALPPVEQQQTMAMQAAGLALAEQTGDLIGLHGAGALGKEVAKTSFLKSMKNVMKGGAEGFASEAPTEGIQTYLEGQIEGKPATAGQIYEAGVIGGASGAGLSGGGRAVAELAKATPEHAAQRDQARQKGEALAAAMQSGDVSGFTDPKSPDYSPAQAIAALHGHSQQATTDEPTKQANLKKADEILSRLQNNRDALAREISPDQKQAQIDLFKEALDAEQKKDVPDAEAVKDYQELIAQGEKELASAAAAPDKAKTKAMKAQLDKLDAELAKARENRSALGTLVTPQEQVDSALNTLKDASKVADHTAAADKVITLAMEAPDRVDPTIAGKIAADTTNGLSESQRSYLRSFSEARQATNALMSMDQVSQDIVHGNAKKGDIGLNQYRAGITASLAAGDKSGAFRQLAPLQRFADGFASKAAAAEAAWKQGFGSQIHRTKSGEWYVASPAQAFKGTKEQIARQLHENGGLAMTSAKLVKTIGINADAINKAAQEMRQAYAMKFAAAKPAQPSAPAQQGAATAATPNTPTQEATGANDVQNTPREGKGPQPEPEAAAAKDPAAAGTGSATTGSGAVSDKGVGAVDVQAAGVAKTKFRRDVLEMFTRDDGAEIGPEGEAILARIPKDLQLAVERRQSLLAGLAEGDELLDDETAAQNRRSAQPTLDALGAKVTELYRVIDAIYDEQQAKATKKLPALARDSQTEGTSGSSVSTTSVDSQSETQESLSGSSVEYQSTEKNTVEQPVKAELPQKTPDAVSSSVTKDTEESASTTVEANAGQLGSLTGKSPEGTLFQSKQLGDFVTQSAGKDNDKTQRPLVAVKDFLSQLTGDLVAKFTGIPVEKLRDNDKQQAVLRLFKSTAKGWFPTLRSNLLKSDKTEFYYKDLMQFLIQGSGKDADLEENLKTAMAYAAFSWVAENATRDAENDNEEINAILGREATHLVSEDERAVLAGIGTRQNLVVNTLGQRVVQALGIKARKDAPKDILPKLQAALGAHVMKLLVDEQIVERNTIPGDVMVGLTGNSDTKAEASNFFLQLSDRSAETITEIATATIGTQGVLDKLFGVESNMKEPSFEKLDFTQKTTKNTNQKVPAKLAQIMAFENATPFFVREDMWALVQQLSDDTLVEIAGAEDLDSKHAANELNTKAKNDGLLREITNFRQFVGSMADVAAGLFFEHTVWKQQRVGIATNVLNPQTSKVHRHMLARQSWTAEVDTANQDQMDNFKLRVLEGLGVKTDKQANKDSLAGFNARFDAKLAKSDKDAKKARALNAGVRVLMEMLEGKDMTPEKQATLVAAVQAGGENMHSLDALMAVAHWKLAEQRGQSTFKTQLMGEVDGVTNGPMLSHLLMGAANTVKDLFGLLNRGGFFEQGNAQGQYNLWRSVAGHLDLYENTARNMTTAVQGYIRDGIRTPKGKLVPWSKNLGAIMNAVYAFTGELSDKDGKVTKDGRNIIKTPLTAMVFGSSVDSAVNSMANKFVEAIYAKIEDSAAGKEGALSAAEIVEHINLLLSIGSFKRGGEWVTGAWLPSSLGIDALMTRRFTPDQITGLKSAFTKTLGKAVGETMENDFSAFIAQRKQFNNAAQLAFALHNSVYTAEREQLMAELVASGEIAGRYQKDEDGNDLTDLPKVALHDLNAEQEAQLQKRLARVLPMMHTLMSKDSGDLSAGLLVSKSDRTISQRSIYESEVKFATKFNAKLGGGNNAGSTRAKAMEVESTSPGVAMAPMSVHSTDSAISHLALDGHEVLNVHDAHGSGIAGFIETAKRLNKATWDAMLAYSPAAEMAATLSRTVMGLADLAKAGTLPPAAVKALAESIQELANKQDMDPQTYLQDLFRNTRAMAAHADRIKFEALAQMQTIDQYALEGGNYEVGEADRAQAKALAEKVSSEVTAEEKAAIDLIEKLIAKEVGEVEAAARDASAERDATESTADTVSEEDKSPAKTRTPFGDLGKASTSRNDAQLVDFFEKTPTTTVKVVIEQLYSQLRTGPAGAQRDFSVKLLMALRKVLSPDMTVKLITADTKESDVLDVPEKPARGWFVVTGSRGNEIYVTGPDFTHATVNVEVVMHEMVHAATAMRLRSADAQAYLAELEQVLEAAREYVTDRKLTQYMPKANDKGELVWPAQLSNVDELVAYGMTNQKFQQLVLAQVKMEGSTFGKLTNALQAFVRAIAGIIGVKGTENANALGVLITNVAALFEQEANDGKGEQNLSLPMAAEANTYSTMDILHGLDDRKGTVGPAFQDHLREILGGIVQTLHGPFGSFKADLMANQAGTPMDVWIKALATGKAPFASKVLATFPVSAQEAFAIEQVEATVKSALNASETRTKMAYRELGELYAEVYRNAKVQDFHDGDWSTATADEKQKASDLYEFTFKIEKANGDRSDYLARFAALGLAHQGFNRVLQRATERSGRKASDAKSFAERLQIIFENILDFFRAKMTHTYKGQQADQKLKALVEQLVDIEAKNRMRLATESEGGSMVERLEATGKQINETIGKAAEKVLNSSFLRNNGNGMVRGAGAVARTIAGNRVDEFLEVMARIRDEHLKERHGWLASLIGEAKGPDEKAKFLLLGTKHNEKIRKDIIDAAANTALSTFANAGKDLTDKDKASISQAFLRAGAHTLLDHFDMAQIEGLLSDPKQLAAAIAQFEGQLTGNSRIYHINQAKALGYYKATGKVTIPRLMMNAGNIARMYATQFAGKLSDDKVQQAEAAIAPLVSLYALSHLNSGMLSQAAAVLKAENARGKTGKDAGNGVEFVLKLHKRLEKESRDRLFEGSDELMMHGYTPEIYNPYTEILVADEVAGKELEDRGWSRGAEVPADPRDPDQQRRHVYVLKGAGLGARQTGIVSWTNMDTSKGSPKHSGYLNPMSQTGLANAQLTADILDANPQAVKSMFTDATFDPAKVGTTYLAPIVNPQGQVVNWRYLMAEQTKDDLLERDNRFEHLLGAMAGSIFDKETSAEQNKKAMQALKEQYDAEYAKQSDRYILVGPTSPDAQLRESWAMLPEVTKQDVRKIWGREGVFVRKDSLDIVFGYRKLSAASMFKDSLDARERRREAGLPDRVMDLDSNEFNMLQKIAIMSVETMLTVWARTQGMNQDQAEAYAKRSATVMTRAGRMWSEVVAETKDLIVVKTGTVLLDNIWSNLSLLVINGVPIKDIIHHHSVALKGATAYHADMEELRKLRLKLDAGHTLGQDAQIKREILRLEDAIARNPITKLVDAGLMPTIVEDIASEDDIYSYKSALTRKAEGVTSKLPTSFKNIAKTIYMTHDTPLYQGLSRVTQLSDFVARYTLYQHLTTRKKDPMSEKDAISRAIDSFIMYDVPMHPLLQYADDTGVFMFTKYFLRIQRVLRTMWHDNPARMLSALLLDHTLGLGPIVLDSAAALRIGNPLQTGAFKIFGSLDELATVKPVISVFGGGRAW